MIRSKTLKFLWSIGFALPQGLLIEGKLYPVETMLMFSGLNFILECMGKLISFFFRQKMPLYILLGYQEKIHIVEFMRHQFLSCTERFPGLVFLNSRKQREFIKFNVYVVLLKLVIG